MPLVDLDPASLEAFAEWMQRPPHNSGAGERILVIKQPTFPQFRFEWHPQAKKVYLIRLGGAPLRGERLAEHVESHGMAYNFVQTFLRGFREGQAPDLTKPHLEG